MDKAHDDTVPKFTLKLFVLNGIKDKILSCGCISNRLLWLGFSDGSYSCLQTTDSDLVFTQLKGGSVRSLHTDATGFHCIIGMSSGQIYYSHLESQKPFLIINLSNVFLRSCTFINSQQECKVLIGTQQGSIIFGNLSKEIFENGTLEKFKNCVTLPDSEPVLGVMALPIIYNESRKLTIIATCSRRLYEFYGGNSVLDTFNLCCNKSSNLHEYLRYQVPLSAHRGELFLVESNNVRFLFWMNGSCIVITRVRQRLSQGSRKSFLEWPPTIFSYTSLNPTSEMLLSQYIFFQVPLNVPRLFVASQHNIYLILEDTLLVTSILTNKIIYSYHLPSEVYGEIKSLFCDSLEKTLWIVTSKLVYRIIVEDEARNLWKLYLENDDYLNAMLACETDTHKSIVTDAHAQYLFDKGDYVNAANTFASSFCTFSFQEISLKFIEVGENEALLTYFTTLLANLRQEAACAIYGPKALQQLNYVRGLIRPKESILIICILQLYIEVLDSLEHQGASESEITPVLNKFYSLLKCYRAIDEIQTPIYKFLHNLGADEYLVKYALMRKDALTFVSQNINSGNYIDAIKFLVSNPNDELLKRFAPILFLHEPVEFAERFNEIANPDSIFTPLIIGLSLKGKHLDNAIKLARKFTIQKDCGSSIVWNLYMLLQCYSDNEIEFGGSPDVDFTLALQCMRKLKKMKAVTGLLGLMGQHREAFDEAMEQQDLELAMDCASKPADLQLKRQLWLKLSEHMSESLKGNDLNQILKKSQVLSLEDVLTRVPSDVTQVLPIFSSTIIEISDQIDLLKEEVERNCDNIQNLQRYRTNTQEFVDIGPNNLCLCCGTCAILDNFFIFNCKHIFHFTCACKLAIQLLDRLAASELEGLMSRPKTPDVLSRITNIVASECLFCGSFMIKSINVPLSG
ncbi:Vacuolar protein sorting-associated protein 18 homolog [Babesia microti strain RI]|uniref:Vacuolar protein sorting-associated protein 18 homolog n=1 Tax=Babesia microti (strain RI) TaxID=1133968 RepID=A0A1N6LWW7_BABMR|nr:Vacuolar protein sorting-associated protein 18 homolog [Babesia microti strain RI]SIO73362.1 Vacuolar protein sorting-associated protein 18 homolog [Babesia microti strain RI]|eukprot:XP_021337463.1 Vacuolar protein sorting-associated protein 18 homolog [Babesia microti strain RI]